MLYRFPTAQCSGGIFSLEAPSSCPSFASNWHKTSQHTHLEQYRPQSYAPGQLYPQVKGDTIMSEVSEATQQWEHRVDTPAPRLTHLRARGVSGSPLFANSDGPVIWMASPSESPPHLQMRDGGSRSGASWLRLVRESWWVWDSDSGPWVLEAAFEGQESLVWGHVTGQWFPRSHASLGVSRAHLQSGMSPSDARVHRGIQWTLSGGRPPEEAWIGRGCFPKHSQWATAVAGFCRVVRGVWERMIRWVCMYVCESGHPSPWLVHRVWYVDPKPCLWRVPLPSHKSQQALVLSRMRGRRSIDKRWSLH
jgi:hypothetical protein